jgi:hypothetical protein
MATFFSPCWIVLVSAVGLSACVSGPRALVFETGTVSRQEWTRIQNECDDEAEKFTASAPARIKFYRWQRLYIACIESRGITYLGPSDQFPHLKDSPERPASAGRDRG